MRMLLIGAVACGWMAALAGGQTVPAKAPATTAASAPAHVADFSEPRKTVTAFLTAENEADLRAALVIGPEHQAEVEALLKTMGAQMRLQAMAAKQYGAEGVKAFGTSSTILADALKRVEQARLVIDPAGNSATITLPPDNSPQHESPTFSAKKIGGQWKLDAASVFKIDTLSKEELAKQLKGAAAVTEATEQTIKDMEAKKFGSAQEALGEYWRLSKEAVAKALPAATAPATKP